jgi:hypothetical protein
LSSEPIVGYNSDKQQGTTEQTRPRTDIDSLIQDDDLLLTQSKNVGGELQETATPTSEFSSSTMEQTSSISTQYQSEPKMPTRDDQTQSKERRVRRPILKKTFALKKVGYKVIPYEDDSDSRYSFTNENVVFVNKANSTYRAEAARGDEFLLRHIIGIVAEAIAETKYPEGKDALELQNRLIAEAIRIHDDSVVKKVPPSAVH